MMNKGLFCRISYSMNRADGVEEEMLLAEKDWIRMKQRSLTSGYRDGLGQAIDEGNQTGFDLGYVQGFREGLSEGKLRGRMKASKYLDIASTF